MTLVDDATAGRVARLIERLVTAGETVAVAESLTGGLLCSTVVNPRGASRAVLGGIVTYSTESKAEVLGVPAEVLASSGPVDSAVAGEMATRVAEKFGASIGIATTGVAGPDAQDGIAVGTVYVAIARADSVSVQKFAFDGGRDSIRWSTVLAALEILENSLGKE